MRGLLSLMLCAGCGRLGFDALASDAGPPPPATVRTLLVPGGSQPFPGATIVVGDAAGAIQSVTTSTGGDDLVDVVPGGMITALYPRGGAVAESFAQTFVGVEPGDVLEFGFHIQSTPTPLGTMTVDIGAATAAIAATPCGSVSGTSPFTISRYATCPATTFDMLISATGYAVVPVTFVDGGTITISVFTPTPTLTVNVTNIPAATTGLTINEAAFAGGFQAEGDAGAGGPPVGGQLTVTMPGEPAFGDFRIVDVASARSSTVQATHHLAHRPPVADRTVDLDLATDALPWITDVAYVPEQQQLSFAVDSEAAYDDVVWTLYDQRAGRSIGAIDWILVSPPGVTGVPLPQLPAAFVEWLPARGDELDVAVALYDVDSWTDYATVRRTPMIDIGPSVLSSFLKVGNALITTASGDGYFNPL